MDNELSRFKRGFENAVLNYICLNAFKWGCTCVIGEYLPTPKNALVKNHYKFLIKDENLKRI